LFFPFPSSCFLYIPPLESPFPWGPSESSRLPSPLYREGSSLAPFFIELATPPRFLSPIVFQTRVDRNLFALRDSFPFNVSSTPRTSLVILAYFLPNFFKRLSGPSDLPVRHYISSPFLLNSPALSSSRSPRTVITVIGVSPFLQ